VFFTKLDHEQRVTTPVHFQEKNSKNVCKNLEYRYLVKLEQVELQRDDVTCEPSQQGRIR
jgi:hypothetical protein